MKRRILVLHLALICLAGLFSQGTGASPDSPLGVDIQFHNQRLYYETDEVFVKITLRNNSSEVQRFRLADARAFSFDFSVQTLANQALEPSEKYLETIGNNESVFTRDVSIRPGEEFSFVERLNDYKKLPAGVYVVTGYFYPELKSAGGPLPIASNRLSLSVRPDARRQIARNDMVAQEVQQILKAQALPPDQVIEYMLNARMKDNREQYFLYMNLESLYMKDAGRSVRYKRLSEMDRLKAIDDYRGVLWSGGQSDQVGMRPDSYDINKSTITQGRNAEVEVIQKYRNPGFTEIKLFRYKLQKIDQIWYLMDYTVMNKGTE